MMHISSCLSVRAGAHLPIGFDGQPRILVYEVQGSQPVQGSTQNALCFLSLLLGLCSQYLHVTERPLSSPATNLWMVQTNSS